MQVWQVLVSMVNGIRRWVQSTEPWASSPPIPHTIALSRDTITLGGPGARLANGMHDEVDNLYFTSTFCPS